VRRNRILITALALGAVSALASAVPAVASQGNWKSPHAAVIARAVILGGTVTKPSGRAVLPDAATYADCVKGKSPQNVNVLEDRFHACLVAHPGEFFYKCKNGHCVKVGAVVLRWIIRSTGRNGHQLLMTDVASSVTSVTGTPNLSLPVTINMVCVSAANGACKSNHPHGITRTLENWLTSSSFTFDFDTSKSIGGGDKIHNNKDGVNYHILGLRVTDPKNHGNGYADGLHFRCDRAGYKINGGCIFSQVIETFVLRLSDSAVAEVAKHIQDALKGPGTLTKPPAKGKVIPGFKSTGMPLTRLLPAYDPSIYKSNRSSAIKACVKWYGKNYATGPHGEKLDCDEFPFASTFQGVSQAHGKWWYTVRPVLSSDNRTAGSRLGAWVAANHILAGDTYWVAIEK